MENDKENVQNILSHIESIKELHGICILLQSNNARVTTGFEYCIKDILTQLHRSACDNLVFCFKNAKISNFRPGESLSALTALLRRITSTNPEFFEVELTSINKKYDTDCEAVRYLYAVVNGLQIDGEEKNAYSSSYCKSGKEIARLLKYLSKIKPHQVKDTLTLHDTRRLLLSHTKAIAEISEKVEQDMNAIREKDRE